MGCSQVLRLIRMELFRTLLMERVEFFDRCAPRCPHSQGCPYRQACSDLSLCLRSWESESLLPRDVLMTGCGCRHTSTELTSLLSIELDSLRSFIFSNVSRDRGLRAILEASGAVLVIITATA